MTLPVEAVKGARIAMASKVADDAIAGTIVARLEHCDSLSVRWDETGRVDALHWPDVARYQWEVTISAPQTDPTLPEIAFLERLTGIRDTIATTAPVKGLHKTSGSAAWEASRLLDAIVENAVCLRASNEGLNDKQRAALVRKVRRVLGYTYP